MAAPLRPWYLAAAALAVAVMIAAIRSDSLWFLNFVHVMTGALWTGIDLFMGFVIGPVMRRVSLDTASVSDVTDEYGVVTPPRRAS